MTETTKEIRKQSGTTAAASGAKRVFVPNVDIYETRDAIVVIADMPGVGAENLEVTLEKNVLAVRGTVAEPSRKGYSAVYAEYDTGEYRRNFTISNEVDRERIEAVVKNGILRLTLHKAELLKARKITVQAA